MKLGDDDDDDDDDDDVRIQLDGVQFQLFQYFASAPALTSQFLRGRHHHLRRLIVGLLRLWKNGKRVGVDKYLDY